MEPININYRDFLIYLMIFGIVIGALFGLIPLILGRRRNQARLGLYGFLASTVAGAVAPILSIVVVAIFSWVIVQKRKSESASTPPGDNESDPAE